MNVNHTRLRWYRWRDLSGPHKQAYRHSTPLDIWVHKQDKPRGRFYVTREPVGLEDQALVNSQGAYLFRTVWKAQNLAANVALQLGYFETK